MHSLQQYCRRINFWLLILLGCCLPLSTSATTVVVLLLTVCWVLEGEFRKKYREIRANPLCLAVFIYFGALLIGLCWTVHLHDGFEVIRERWKILLLPIFLTTVRWERRFWYIIAYITGVTLVMLLITLAWFDLLSYVGLGALAHRNVLTNHIVFTPMLAFATYLLLHHLLWGDAKGVQRWLLIGLTGWMIFTIFITKGRAGQIVFFLLLALLLFQYFQKRLWRAVFLGIVLLPLIFTTAYHLSPLFQSRVDLVQKDIMTFNQNPETSIGLRLIFWKTSWKVIKHSPWFGVGTGDFASSYAQVYEGEASKAGLSDNPHNQYIFLTAQLGVLGLLSLLGIFGTQIYQSRQVQDGWQRIRLAFPLFFMVIMMTDSYLDTSSSGFLFALLSSVLAKSNMLHEQEVGASTRMVPNQHVRSTSPADMCAIDSL
jgi:O-antigen ligase